MPTRSIVTRLSWGGLARGRYRPQPSLARCMSSIRLTAQERRDQIVDAAVDEFALGGFGGIPAAVIALRAGVSQPYLFALSGMKRNLFIAAVQRGSERMRSLILRAAGEGGEGDDALNGVRTALLSLRRERTLPPLQLRAFAAC